MSGPALRQVDSHHAIHEAAHHEAAAMTSLLERATEHEDSEVVLQIAFMLVEHWETRILAHAKAEEDGLYRDIVRDEPEKASIVFALVRDHELMRTAVKEIKEYLQSRKPVADVVQRFHLLLWLNQTHSHDEERRLITSLTANRATDLNTG